MKFACPHCSQVYTADESKAGSVRDCPNCQKTFQFPASDSGPSGRRRFGDDDRASDDRPRNRMESKRIVAGLLGIFLGGLGIHKFYLGYTQAALIQLLLLFCTCGMSKIFGMVEGIIYLTKSDDEFIRTYQLGRKEWL